MDIEEQVYNFIIEHCVGKENMIKNSILRKYFPQIKSDKAMRKVIQNIRIDPGFPIFIGSLSGNRGGYYACTNQQEMNETIDNLMKRAYQIYLDCEAFRTKEVIEFAKR